MDAQAALIILFLMPSVPGALFTSGSFLITLSSLLGLSILSMILMSSAELWTSFALVVGCGGRIVCFLKLLFS